MEQQIFCVVLPAWKGWGRAKISEKTFINKVVCCVKKLSGASRWEAWPLSAVCLAWRLEKGEGIGAARAVLLLLPFWYCFVNIFEAGLKAETQPLLFVGPEKDQKKRSKLTFQRVLKAFSPFISLFLSCGTRVELFEGLSMTFLMWKNFLEFLSKKLAGDCFGDDNWKFIDGSQRQRRLSIEGHIISITFFLSLAARNRFAKKQKLGRNVPYVKVLFIEARDVWPPAGTAREEDLNVIIYLFHHLRWDYSSSQDHL